MQTTNLYYCAKRIAVIFVVVILSLGSANSQPASSEIQLFDLLGSPADTGFKNDILAISNYGGDLVVGGKFFNDGDGGIAGRVAGWDGSNWYGMGGIFAGPEVYALHESGGLLYAATFAPILYAWNGASWSSVGPTLGAGIYGSIFTVDTFQNEIIIGGTFKFDPLQPSYVAKYNGATWDTLGNGLIGEVRDLIVYDGNLIAAGQIVSEKIMMWNGTAWSSLGGGVNGIIYAMVIYNSDLVVAGIFTDAGGVSVANVARWDGTNWYAMTSNLLNKPCFALTVHDGVLIAGGGVTGFSWGYVQAWSGSNWSYLGGVLEFDGWVRSLGIYDTTLVAGGEFDSTGGGSLAAWNGTSWEALNGLITSAPERISDLLPQNFSVSQNFPNPFNPSTTIEYNIPRRSNVTVEIFNMLGQEIKTLHTGSQSPGTYSIRWDGSDKRGNQVSTGVYLYRIQAGEYVVMKKMMLMK